MDMIKTNGRIIANPAPAIVAEAYSNPAKLRLKLNAILHHSLTFSLTIYNYIFECVKKIKRNKVIYIYIPI